jgi:hypothetical protein
MSSTRKGLFDVRPSECRSGNDAVDYFALVPGNPYDYHNGLPIRGNFTVRGGGRSSVMSSLAKPVYDILRRRVDDLDDPRISYAELARALREASEEFDHITHRSQELYRALGEVADECGRLGLPSLAALVVRADSRRPGDAYYAGMEPQLSRGERIAVWREELEAVKQAEYPASVEESD